MELQENGAALRAKVLAPATKTEFGMRANHVDAYDYDQALKTYHTAEQMAAFKTENITKAMDPLQHNGSMAWNY